MGMASGELGEVLLGNNKISVGRLGVLSSFSGRQGWEVGFG